MDKLKSRKFWFAIVGALLPVVNEAFGLKLPLESLYAIIAYLFGQSAVDAMAARKG